MKRLAAAVGWVLLLVLPAWQEAAASEQTVIYACVNNNGANKGQVRIVAASEPCAKNEVRIQWNVAGPPGPTGGSNLAGFTCPEGQAVIGFDLAGAPLCSASVGGGGGGSGVADADGDGIPDAVDPCPNAANVPYGGGSYCPVTVYQVTMGVAPPGTGVSIANLMVTSVTGSTITLATIPGDPAYDPTIGDAYAFVTIDAGGLTVPAVFSRVNIVGTVLPGGTVAPAFIVVVSGP